jgi:AraC family transcriptional regulator, ethanolamine operon transcriptional activator
MMRPPLSREILLVHGAVAFHKPALYNSTKGQTRTSIEFPQKMNIPPRCFESIQRVFLPAVTAIEVRDPTVVDEGIGVLRQDLLLLETKPFRARQLMVRLEDSMVLFQETNLRVRLRTELHRGLLAYVVFGPRSTGAVNGLPVGPNLMLAAESGIQVEFVAEAGYESVAFLCSPDVLMSHLAGWQRKDNLRVPHGIEVLHTKEAYVRRLFDWGKRLANAVTRHPELLNDRRETILATQTELIEMLLAALDATTIPQFTVRDLTRQARSRVVKLAEDYALAHTDDRFYVTDLCVATGVSERTLDYAFREVAGMSPVAYLTRLRLHRVRKALQMATHGSTTVSAQALRWGFGHFGDFSCAYKHCFDELPSETLRRKPVETCSNPKALQHSQ